MGRAILSRGHSTNLVPRHTSLPCCPHGTTSNSPSGQDSYLGAHRPIVGRPTLPHDLGRHARKIHRAGTRRYGCRRPCNNRTRHDRARPGQLRGCCACPQGPLPSFHCLTNGTPPGGGNAFEPCSLGSTDAHHPPSPTRRDRLTVTRALIFVPSNTGALRARGRVGRIRVPLLQGGCPDREDSGDQHTLQTITGNA